MTDVVLLDPLAAGIVRWTASGPATTLVVKATFTLDEGPEPRLAAPDPLCVDTPDPAGDGMELRLASDFAPLKPRVDLLLTGHACAPAPTTRHAIRLACEGWERRLVVTSPDPSTRFALLRRNLRDAGAWDGSPAAVAGLSPRDPARARRATGHPVALDGWPEGPLGTSFDAGFFNAAPDEQQLASIPPWLWIEGVFPGAAVRALWLGGRWPFALAVRHDGGTEEVSFDGDTIAIDVDRSVLSLAWRARIDLPALARMAIALGHLDDPPSEEDLVLGMGDRDRVSHDALPTYVAPSAAMVRQETAVLDGFAVVPGETRDIVVDPPSSGSLPFASPSSQPVAPRPVAGIPFAPSTMPPPPGPPLSGGPGAAPVEGTPFARPSIAPPSTGSLRPPQPPPPRPPLETRPDEPLWTPAATPPPPAPATPPAPRPPPAPPPRPATQPPAHDAPAPAAAGVAIVPARPSRIARYAAARAAIEAGERPDAAARAHGFTPADWERQHHAMLRKARVDPAFERELTAAMAQARSAHVRAAGERAARATSPDGARTSAGEPLPTSRRTARDGVREPSRPAAPRDPVA